MSKLRVLDLFSGIGGFSLGLERTGGFETAAFCEYEPFPRAVLAKHWPNVPCFPDVRKLKGSDIDGPVDVICGGYPCQPFSTAGRRRGKEDDRHLWPEFNRLVAELRPTWVIGENVAGHISMGLDDVLSDLEGQGYACRTFVIPACAVDAPHRRDRVWIVAHSKGQRANGRPGKVSGKTERQKANNRNIFGKSGEAAIGDVAHANVIGSQGHRRSRKVSRADGQWSGDFGAEGGGNVVLADANNDGGRYVSREQCTQEKKPLASICGDALADSIGKRQPRQGQPVIASDCAAEGEGKANHAFAVSQPGKWSAEPDVGRVANGVPRRVDRLKALGNAVVPQIPEMIGRAILAAEQGDNK